VVIIAFHQLGGVPEVLQYGKIGKLIETLILYRNGKNQFWNF
jgi:hypothetical protein